MTFGISGLGIHEVSMYFLPCALLFILINLLLFCGPRSEGLGHPVIGAREWFF